MDKPLVSIEAMIDRLQQTKDKPVDLTVLRGNQTLDFPRNAGARRRRKIRNSRSIGWDF